jgi:hypothetical protein
MKWRGHSGTLELGPDVSMPMRSARALLLTVALIGVACGGAASGDDPTPTATATPSPSPTPEPTGNPLNQSQLELAVLDALDDPLDYCDPDSYPVARGKPIDAARGRFPQIKRDREAFEAILEHEGLERTDEFTDQQLIAINELYKRMSAIRLAKGGDVHRFELQVRRGQESLLLTGTVDSSGRVAIEREDPAPAPNCPICLARGTRIATPAGSVAVSQLRVGDRAWSVGRDGRRIIATVLAASRTRAPLGHELIRVRLTDGRLVEASYGHPTANGRTLGSLRAGDWLDGSRVAAVTPVGYRGSFTFDIRVSGPTGLYVADGVVLASTLIR